jgi:acetyltransferase
METPPSIPGEFAPDAASARRVVDKCLADGRSRLDPLEMAELLRAYAIEAVPTTLARDEAEAEAAAAPYLGAGGAVVAKILSRDIVHKSDVDGVRLNLTTAAAVREATAVIIAAAHAARPDAEIAGVIIQPMIVRPKARELIVGIADDPTFGPVIVFGHGGIAVEVIDDKAIALPPLDLKLARDLIGRTRVSRLLRAYRRVPAVDETQLALVLVKLAQIAADLPEIRELDINPLLADEAGMIALDARAVVGAAPQRFKGPHKTGFAIRPYPSEWERHVVLPDGGKVFIRPVRAEDEALFLAFIPRVTAEDLRLRFFAPIRTFTHAFIARLTQLDYARAMAFIAIDEGNGDMLGVVRLHADANYENGEYAILVRSDLKGHGLGWTLMQLIIEYARATGLKRIEAQVLRENSVMLQMCRELGFEVKDDPEDPSLTLVSLVLATPA